MSEPSYKMLEILVEQNQQIIQLLKSLAPPTLTATSFTLSSTSPEDVEENEANAVVNETTPAADDVDALVYPWDTADIGAADEHGHPPIKRLYVYDDSGIKAGKQVQKQIDLAAQIEADSHELPIVKLREAVDCNHGTEYCKGSIAFKAEDFAIWAKVNAEPGSEISQLNITQNMAFKAACERLALSNGVKDDALIPLRPNRIVALFPALHAVLTALQDSRLVEIKAGEILSATMKDALIVTEATRDFSLPAQTVTKNDQRIGTLLVHMARSTATYSGVVSVAGLTLKKPKQGLQKDVSFSTTETCTPGVAAWFFIPTGWEYSLEQWPANRVIIRYDIDLAKPASTIKPVSKVKGTSAYRALAAVANEPRDNSLTLAYAMTGQYTKGLDFPTTSGDDALVKLAGYDHELWQAVKSLGLQVQVVKIVRDQPWKEPEDSEDLGTDRKDDPEDDAADDMEEEKSSTSTDNTESSSQTSTEMEARANSLEAEVDVTECSDESAMDIADAAHDCEGDADSYVSSDCESVGSSDSDMNFDSDNDCGSDTGADLKLPLTESEKAYYDTRIAFFDNLYKDLIDAQSKYEHRMAALDVLNPRKLVMHSNWTFRDADETFVVDLKPTVQLQCPHKAFWIRNVYFSYSTDFELASGRKPSGMNEGVSAIVIRLPKSPAAKDLKRKADDELADDKDDSKAARQE